jgi:hypothetical protein
LSLTPKFLTGMETDGSPFKIWRTYAHVISSVVD